MGSAYTEKAGVVVQSDLVAEKQQGGGEERDAGALAPNFPGAASRCGPSGCEKSVQR